MMSSSGFPGNVASNAPSLAERLTAFLPALVLPDPLGAREPLDGAILQARFSGFAALAESLAKIGREGAEVLTRVLNNYFGPFNRALMDCGGQILKFDGQTMLVYFPGSPEVALPAAASASYAALKVAEEFYPVQTADGRYSFSTAIGLAYGSFKVMVIGADLLGRSILYAGEVFDNAREAALQAEAGKSLTWQADTTQPTEKVEFSPAGKPGSGAFFGNEDPLSIYNRISPYLPRVLAQKLKTAPGAPLPGEFRRVVNIYVQVPAIDLNNAQNFEALQEYYLDVQRVCSNFDGRIHDVVPMERDQAVRFHLTFGALLSNSEDAEHALKTALKVRDLKTPSGEPPILGVASGNVFSGSVGNAQSQRYIVLGEAVSLSTRFAEAAAEQGSGTALVDRYTRERVGLTYLFGDDIILNLADRPFPVRASRLLAQRPAACSLSTFVRDIAPSGVLPTGVLGTFDEVLNNGRRVLLLSDTGQTAHLAQRWLKRGGAGASGACIVNADSVPYLAWSGLLGGLLGLNDTDSRTEKAAKLSQAVARYIPGYAVLTGWLNMLVGLAPEEPGFRERIASQRTQFDKLIIQLIGGMAAVTPQLLILRDLHWSDEPGFALLEQAVKTLEKEAVLFCLTLQRGANSEIEERVQALPGLVSQF